MGNTENQTAKVLFTHQENMVSDKLIEAWNEFAKLPELHKDDTLDFRHHIHALQRIIFSRPLLKVLNGQSDYKEDCHG